MEIIEKSGSLTIADVAREAGVSTATVSRVLNGRNTVSKEAAERVRKAVERIGYNFPVPASRRGPKPVMHPMGLKHGSIVLICTPMTTQTGQFLLQGVSRAMRERQIDLSVQYMDGGHSQLSPALASGKVDGLILQGSSLPADMTEQLSKLPAVWLLYRGDHSWGDRVQPDHRGVGTMVLNHFAGQHQPPFCCMTYQSRKGLFDYWTERQEAFAQQARINMIDHVVLGNDEPECKSDQDRVATAQRLVEQFMALSPRPKGLFLAMNDLGCFVADELAHRGVRLMKDVCLVAGDIESVYRPIRPVPITVDIRSVEIGYLSVGLLLNRIANPALPRITQFVEPRLIFP